MLEMDFGVNHTRRATKAALMIFVGILIGIRFFQISMNPIDDFDTNMVLKAIGGAEGSPTLIGLAHPGLLSAIVKLLGKLVGLGFSPESIWHFTLISAVLMTCALIFFIVSSAADASWAPLLAVVLFLASPVTADIAARSEENLLTQLIFVGALVFAQRTLTDRSGFNLMLLATSSLVLVSQHIQASVVFLGGLALHVVAQYARSHAKDDFLMARNVLICACVPAVFYMLALGFFGAFDFMGQQSGYMRSFHSLFNNDGLLEYISSYFMFLQGYVVGGVLNFAWIDGQTHPAQIVQALGYIVFSAVIFLCRRLSFFGSVCLLGLFFHFCTSHRHQRDGIHSPFLWCFGLWFMSVLFVSESRWCTPVCC